MMVGIKIENDRIIGGIGCDDSWIDCDGKSKAKKTEECNDYSRALKI